MATSTPSKQLVVLSHLNVHSLKYKDEGQPILPEVEQRKDGMDLFNHPRLRRALILQALKKRSSNSMIRFVAPPIANDLSIYALVHTEGLLAFLLTAWTQWESLDWMSHSPHY